ncbi:MAG: LCP family protein [Bacilli bacterium]|nr:LCP family protein [Bacilli bacterium]
MKKILPILKYAVIIIMIILSCLFIKNITDLNVLPTKYYVILLLVIILLNIGGAILLLLKKVWTKIVGGIICSLLLLISLIGIFSLGDVNKFLNKAFNNNTIEISTYKVVTLKSSKYEKIEDLKDKDLGYLSNDEHREEVLKNVEDKVSTEKKEYEDFYNIYQDFITEKIDAMVLDVVYLEILGDEFGSIYDCLDTCSFNDDYKVLDTFEIKTERKITDNHIDELKPFNIFVSGSDSRSNVIYNKSRSDVNMILTVNPNTKTVLMTTIPRDYYVQVHGQTGLKDKLTHAGIYGVDISRQTVEDLFDIEIAYSIKVGFPSVVKLVDLVGGVDIDSDREFNSYHMKGWTVKKGINHMDGAHALAYSRERYAYTSGDRHRVLNQQQVLEAVIKKVITNKSLLLKYNELLNSLSELYRTDMPKDVVTLLVKDQLENMNSWNFESQTVSGSDASSPTHTAPKSKRYVMIPYAQDVKRAHDKINEIMNN